MEYLKANGYEILETKYRCPYGEIDIIAKESDQTIVFVEVKARSSTSYGHALEAVTPLKCQRIRKTSMFYIHKKQYTQNQMYRYDVIAFQNNRIQHIRNII